MEGTSAARLKIGDQAGGKIPEAGGNPQGYRERTCEVPANVNRDLRVSLATAQGKRISSGSTISGRLVI
jgi:hypothetical protein